MADISYFDDNGDPEHVDGASLPWSLEFAITTATGVGSIAAQGDSDSIGCRIMVDGVVKAEKTHARSERLYLLPAEGRMSNHQLQRQSAIRSADDPSFFGAHHLGVVGDHRHREFRRPLIGAGRDKSIRYR